MCKNTISKFAGLGGNFVSKILSSSKKFGDYRKENYYLLESISTKKYIKKYEMVFIIENIKNQYLLGSYIPFLNLVYLKCSL